MQPPRDIQAQLRSLSIPTELRPTSPKGRSLRIFLAVLAVAAGMVVIAVLARDRIAPALRGLTARAEKPASVELLTVAVTPPPGPTPALTATGKIVSDHTVSVATKVSGQIGALVFAQGDFL